MEQRRASLLDSGFAPEEGAPRNDDEEVKSARHTRVSLASTGWHP
jgi:hypothetical protein